MANLNINLTSSQVITMFMKVNRDKLFTNSWTTMVSTKKSAGCLIDVIDNIGGEGEIEFRFDPEFYRNNQSWILSDLKKLKEPKYYKFGMKQKTTGKEFILTLSFYGDLSAMEDNGRKYLKLTYFVHELR